jgi:hypothetical protein
VDIAHYVERKILDRWGEAFWVLNPAKYQLESKAGKGLLDQHAKNWASTSRRSNARPGRRLSADVDQGSG